MATAPREHRVAIQFDMPGDAPGAKAIGDQAIMRYITWLVAAEVERRVATERAGFLRVLAWLTFEHGTVETATDGTTERATIRVPDRVLVGDDPVVSTWRDEMDLTTAYRVERRRA